MPDDLTSPISKIRRSRRNFMKMGAVVASVTVADLWNPKSANASGDGDDWHHHHHHHCDDDGDDGNCTCFLKGTTIRTVEGNAKVEDLAVGDLLLTVFGGPRPIQWIGRYRFEKSSATRAWVREVLPVRIVRSALAQDVPHADLYVTQGHALLIDGFLIPAAALINDASIVLYEACDREELEFFHVKLADHDAIYAEGAPCETMFEVDENAANFADYYRRYGYPSSDEVRCAPMLHLPGRKSKMKSRFRSALSPWIDRRQQIDIIRDRLEERGIALLQQAQPAYDR